MIDDERIEIIHQGYGSSGSYVLYWMQAAQRTSCNHALEYAIREANRRNLPLVVYFGVCNDFPEAGPRHYRFMLEGLRETLTELKALGANPVFKLEAPEKGVVKLAAQAALTVFDKAYTAMPRSWRKQAAASMDCPVVEVEGEVIVPVRTASHKEEYAAATLRPRINRVRDRFLHELETSELKNTRKLDLECEDFSDPDAILQRLELKSDSPAAVDFYHGGTSQAHKRLDDFIAHKLDFFADKRNDPATDYCSGLSPYLHFGQISPLTTALKVLHADSPGTETFLEEFIVRRELAVNFVYFNPAYDSYSCLPTWARLSLGEHAADPRQYLYTAEELEHARTHDPYWNAAQSEMLITGKMHGYMRMYWGKKILEWTRSPEEAYQLALHLNNKYELDGRDPNAFAGVAWCFGKHDRPWKERPVFGKIRYMNDNGLKRKFDIEAYIHRVNSLIK